MRRRIVTPAKNSKRQTAPSKFHFSSEQQTENVTTADRENQSTANNISSKFKMISIFCKTKNSKSKENLRKKLMSLK